MESDTPEEPKPFCHKDTDDESEGGQPPTLSSPGNPPYARRNRGIRRKEVEARRFNGKENVEEYLLQFELTSRRNGWDDDEKAIALLCALEGVARGILSEFDDPTTASYVEVKKALLRRFGPTQLLEVHEQFLSQLRLGKNQSIRELAHEVQRVVKQAYPDIVGPPRERLAIKHLLNAIPDKDTVFYVRDKNPADISEACTLYERYLALTDNDTHKRSGVKGVSNARTDPEPVEPSTLSRQVTEAIERMTQVANQQMQKFTEAMTRLQTPPGHAPPLASTAPPARAAARPTHPAHTPAAPSTPCPRCGQIGHWARDCPQPPRRTPGASATLNAHAPPFTASDPSAPPAPCHRCGKGGHWAKDCTLRQRPAHPLCFHCGQPGHRQRECPSLNFPGPVPAPGAGFQQ